jgi:hypothetical protein
VSEALGNFEGLLREALAPVEPPEDLVMRLEGTLQSLTEIAAEELESWELSTMRDPRNWVRPVGAVLVGGSAGAALVLLRARHRRHSSGTPAAVLNATERALQDLSAEARKLLGRS